MRIRRKEKDGIKLRKSREGDEGKLKSQNEGEIDEDNGGQGT
jgi:hypothetical protein